MKLSRDFFKCHWEALLHTHTHTAHIFLSEVLNNSAVLSRLGQLGPVGPGTSTSVCARMRECVRVGLSLSHRQTAGLNVRILSDICLTAAARHTYTHTQNMTAGEEGGKRMSRKSESRMDVLLSRQASRG